ncbi:hypothetical protein GCM10009529_28180 [Micropruina glycogenica]
MPEPVDKPLNTRSPMRFRARCPGGRCVEGLGVTSWVDCVTVAILSLNLVGLLWRWGRQCPPGTPQTGTARVT